MPDKPYPLFPKLSEGQIHEILVFKNAANRKAKVEDWTYHWVNFHWPHDMTKLQFGRLVGGGHYEVRAYGGPNESNHLGTYVHKAAGTPRDVPPDEAALLAMQQPTAHETAQRAIITTPGLSPELNTVFASWQQMATNYREDAGRAHTALLTLLEAYIAREKSNTLEQQLIIQLRADNMKLANAHEKLLEQYQESQLETVEQDARSKNKHGLAGMAVEAIASRLPDVVKPLLEKTLQELVSKPEYVQAVAKAHGQLNASVTSGDAAAE